MVEKNAERATEKEVFQKVASEIVESFVATYETEEGIHWL